MINILVTNMPRLVQELSNKHPLSQENVWSWQNIIIL